MSRKIICSYEELMPQEPKEGLAGESPLEEILA